jgi:hypothetical protein
VACILAVGQGYGVFFFPIVGCPDKSSVRSIRLEYEFAKICNSTSRMLMQKLAKQFGFSSEPSLYKTTPPPDKENWGGADGR